MFRAIIAVIVIIFVQTALPAAPPAAVPAEWTGAMAPDPKCLADAPWEVDPAAQPMRLYGCRPLSAMPAPGPDGWVTYTRPQVNGTDAGWLRVKLIAQPTVSSWKFQVVDNGGGSGNFGYTVSGEADAQGWIQRPVVTIMP